MCTREVEFGELLAVSYSLHLWDMWRLPLWGRTQGLALVTAFQTCHTLFTSPCRTQINDCRIQTGCIIMTPAKHPRLQTVKRRSRNVSQAPKLSSSDMLWHLETEQPASVRYFTWMKKNNIFWILILYILSEGVSWMTISKVVNEAIKLQHWYLEVAWHQNTGQPSLCSW